MTKRPSKFIRHICPKCGASFYTHLAWAKHTARPALCEAYRQGVRVATEAKAKGG